jgi:hypothetical protein
MEYAAGMLRMPGMRRSCGNKAEKIYWDTSGCKNYCMALYSAETRCP